MAKEGSEVVFLSKCSIFEGCAPETAAHLASSPVFLKKQYKKGERVVYDGGALGILYEGKMRIGAGRTHGKVMLNRLHPGAVFGFSSLFSKKELFETDIRAENKVTVGWIPEELLAELIAMDAHLARNIISVQSEKIRFLNERIRSYTAPTAEEQLYAFLLKLPEDERGVRVLPCRMAPLAANLGIGRASLYRALEKLTEEHKIKREGDNVILLNEKEKRN